MKQVFLDVSKIRNTRHFLRMSRLPHLGLFFAKYRVQFSLALSLSLALFRSILEPLYCSSKVRKLRAIECEMISHDLSLCGVACFWVFFYKETKEEGPNIDKSAFFPRIGYFRASASIVVASTILYLCSLFYIIVQRQLNIV